MIELKGIERSFQMGDETILALAGVSFKILEGEWVSITGPSGSGKSTLMNILGLLDMPNAGSYSLDGIEVFGRNDDELAELRNEKIGFIFQSFHLLPRYTALKNVELPLVYTGIEPAERQARAIEALRMVNLENRLHHLPNELSGGQRQRVAIARALVQKPAMLLADEPTGNLDSKSGTDIIRLFGELNDKGVTLMVVTHDPVVAEKGKRILRIFDGKIVEDRRVRGA